MNAKHLNMAVGSFSFIAGATAASINLFPGFYSQLGIGITAPLTPLMFKFTIVIAFVFAVVSLVSLVMHLFDMFYDAAKAKQALDTQKDQLLLLTKELLTQAGVVVSGEEDTKKAAEDALAAEETARNAETELKAAEETAGNAETELKAAEETAGNAEAALNALQPAAAGINLDNALQPELEALTHAKTAANDALTNAKAAANDAQTALANAKAAANDAQTALTALTIYGLTISIKETCTANAIIQPAGILITILLDDRETPKGTLDLGKLGEIKSATKQILNDATRLHQYNERVGRFRVLGK